VSSFREAQRQAHPSKTNTLLLGVICVHILILGMQIWLLTAALNVSLEGVDTLNVRPLCPSGRLFSMEVAVLPYRPNPFRRSRKASQSAASRKPL